ncbi:Proteolipid membrane potential modulator, partial [Cynara cardunculus var. scolymus]
MGAETFVEIILAIILPPIGVFLRYGCGVSNLNFSSLSIDHYDQPFRESDSPKTRCFGGLVQFVKLIVCIENADRILDMFIADDIGLSSGYYIRNLCFGCV